MSTDRPQHNLFRRKNPPALRYLILRSKNVSNSHQQPSPVLVKSGANQANQASCFPLQQVESSAPEQKSVFTPSTASLVDWSDFHLTANQSQLSKAKTQFSQVSDKDRNFLVEVESTQCTLNDLMDSFPIRSPNKATLSRLQHYINPGIKLLRNQYARKHSLPNEQSSSRLGDMAGDVGYANRNEKTNIRRRSLGQRWNIEPDVSSLIKHSSSSTIRDDQPFRNYPGITGRSYGLVDDLYPFALPTSTAANSAQTEHLDATKLAFRDRARRELRDRQRRELLREIFIMQQGLQASDAPPTTPMQIRHFGIPSVGDEDVYRFKSGRKQITIVLPSADPGELDNESPN